MALAKAAAATGKPVILVLTEGRPRFISNIEPAMKGILMAYWWKETVKQLLIYCLATITPMVYCLSAIPAGEVVMYDRKPTGRDQGSFCDDVCTPGNPLFAFGLKLHKFWYSELSLNTNKLKGDEN